MISKEERAELRRELAKSAPSFPLPWRQGCPDEVIDDYGHTVADCVERHRTGDSAEECIIAAVNAMPVLLDALDAADAEIAGLKAEVAALKASTTTIHVDESLRMAFDTEIASLKARIAELEAAAQSAIFALQPTWAQDPASSAVTLGRAIAAHQESLQALAKGCDYVASQTDGYDRIVAEPMIALGLLTVVGTDEDGDDLYKRVRLAAPIPALPEGGV